MTAFLYRCPTTSLKVQGGVADAPTEPKGQAVTYVAVQCLACGQMHLVDPLSGKVAGFGEAAGVGRDELSPPQ
jgi:hypothetical protein